MNFNPVEIFKIAKRLEESGMGFYQSAAAFTKDENLKAIFQDLSNMEKSHYNWFSRMEKNAKDCSYSDTDDIAAYMGAKFSPSVYTDNDSAKIGGELKSILDVFRFALEKELEGAKFYALIKNTVSDAETREALDRIIEEEKGHAALIKDYISRLDQ